MNSSAERNCSMCGCDISKRHRIAKVCFSCARTWGKRTGSEKASLEVSKAVRRGDIPPAKTLSCVDCGNQARDYDHRDYNKPLDVVPVCRPCNKLRGPAIKAVAA